MINVFPKSEMKKIAEKFGYTGYLPVKFLRLLELTIRGYMIHADPRHYCTHLPYNFNKLIDFINFEEFMYFTPMDGSMKFLQKYNNKLNLRSIEIAVEDETKAVELEDKDQQNYSFDLGVVLTSGVKEALDIQIDDKDIDNTVKLTPELCDILSFYSKLSVIGGKDTVSPEDKYVPLPSISKVTKIKSYKYVLYDFAYKLAGKKFEIEEETINFVDFEEVNIFMDTSSSMKSFKTKFTAAYKAILLSYLDRFKINSNAVINLHFFRDTIVYRQVIDSYDLLYTAIQSPPQLADFSFSDTKSVFIHIGKHFSNQEVVIVTDANINVSKAIIPYVSAVRFKAIVLGNMPQKELRHLLARTKSESIVL